MSICRFFSKYSDDLLVGKLPVGELMKGRRDLSVLSKAF